MAFLVLLESLSPLERAVFLLREVFDYEYAEIAQITGRERSGLPPTVQPCKKAHQRTSSALSCLAGSARQNGWPFHGSLHWPET